MTSCVNRNCSRPVATFLEGRLFHFEVTSISVAADDTQRKDFDETPQRKGMYFWLCGSCAATMTLILEPVGGLQLVPLAHFAETSVTSDAGQFPAFLGALR